MNDGDWVESCTALVEHNDGRWEIVTWTQEKTNESTENTNEDVENFMTKIKSNIMSDPEKAKEEHFETLDDTSKEIINILEEYVKPAVASDGGNIQFESYDEITKNVKVILQGACSGCPSSTYTLKSGIENMLKEMLPGKVETVEAING